MKLTYDTSRKAEHAKWIGIAGSGGALIGALLLEIGLSEQLAAAATAFATAALPFLIGQFLRND